MFPGFGVPKKGWDTYYDDNNVKQKTNFIKELKKLGDIYFHEPLYHNLTFYDKKYKKYQSIYNKNIDFTKEDFDVEAVCEKVYNDVKDFNGKYILIGHSIGSYFLYHFAQKYHSKVLFSVNIDGCPLGPIEQTLNDKKDLYPKIKKYSKYTNEDLEKLKEKVYDGDTKTIGKIFDIAFYNIFKYKKVTLKAKKLKKPMISFFDFNIQDNKGKKIIYFEKFNIKRIEEIEHFTKNNDNYTSITFVNKTHYPHHEETSKNVILENIKLMIDKYL